MHLNIWTQHGKWSCAIPTTHKCETVDNIEARCAIRIGITVGEVVLCLYRDNNEDSEYYINQFSYTLALCFPHYLGIKGLQ